MAYEHHQGVAAHNLIEVLVSSLMIHDASNKGGEGT